MAKVVQVTFDPKAVIETFDPEGVIGKPYHRGDLPYGGGVGPDGRIVFARSREEAERRIRKYRALTQ